MPVELIEGEKKRDFDAAPLAIGAILILIGASLASLIYLQRPTLSLVWHQGIRASFADHWLALMSCALSAIPTLVLLVAGPMLCLSAFTDFSFPRRPRYKVPDGYHRRVFLPAFHPVEFLEDNDAVVVHKTDPAKGSRG